MYMILKIGFLIDTEISRKDLTSQLQSELVKITDSVHKSIMLIHSSSVKIGVSLQFESVVVSDVEVYQMTSTDIKFQVAMVT